MGEISRKVKINSPVEQVWEVVAQFGDIYKFSPGVPNSHLTSEQSGGVGATRHCDLAMAGASIEERVIGWTENQLCTIEIYGGKKIPPFSSATGTFRLTADGEGTEVEFTLTFAQDGIVR